MSFDLNYSLNIDFPNKKANADRLILDIYEAGAENAVDAISIKSDKVTIVMRGEYSLDCENAINAAVGSHTGEKVSISDKVELIEDRTETTGGSFQGCMWEWTIPAGEIGAETKLSAEHETNGDSIKFPFPISTLFASWKANAENDGDEARFVAGENTPVGALTVNASAGSSVLRVSDTVLKYAYIGHVISLNGVPVGRCVGTSIGNLTLTIEAPLERDYPAGTYVMLTKEIARRIYFDESSGCRFDFGGNRIGGALLPAGVECNLIYKNKSTESKRLRLYIEYVL